jgi:HEAT repeat protein
VLGLWAALAAGGEAGAEPWHFDWAGRVALEADGLVSEDATARAATVARLANYSAELSAPYLLKALTDPDEVVRLEAASACGRREIEGARAALLTWTGDGSARVRAVAVEALGKLGGDGAAAVIVRSLGDADPGVRGKAVGALGHLGVRGDRSVVSPLIARLSDDKSEVRRKVLEELERLADRRATIPVVALFSDASPEVRKAAIRAAVAAGDPAAVPALLRQLRDPVEDLRATAIGALGVLAAQDAAEPLLELLDAGSRSLRSRVANALGQIILRDPRGAGSQRALAALVGMLATPLTGVARNPNPAAASRGDLALEALRAAGPAAVPAVIERLEGDGEVSGCVALLREARDPRATAALIAELERGRTPIPAVLAALAAIGDSRALLPVLERLSSKDEAIRLAALRTVGSVVGDDQRAADILLPFLRASAPEAQELAARTIGKLRHAAAVPTLVELTAPPAPDALRRTAIDALGEIGDPAAVPALLELLRDGPAGLRQSAASALAYLIDARSAAKVEALALSPRWEGQRAAVLVLAALLRRHPPPSPPASSSTIATLRRLTRSPAVAAGAIAALAAGPRSQVEEDLLPLAASSSMELRRVAVAALGDVGSSRALPLLRRALVAGEEPVAAAAAWALGEVAVSRASCDPADVARLQRAASLGRSSVAVNAAGALARIAESIPPELRPQAQASALELLQHRSRLVRNNAMWLLVRLHAGSALPPPIAAQLAVVAEEDPSPGVRRTALRALGRTSSRDATGVTPATPTAIPPRDEWRHLHIVEADDPAVAAPHVSMFAVTSDGLALTFTTDASGDFSTEHFPAGDAIVLPVALEQRY